MRSEFARVSRAYPMAAPAIDSETARANDYFSNSAARTGWGTNSLTEATDYELVRLSFNYWLLVTLYRNHWIARKIVDTPAKDMTSAWPRLTSDIEPADLRKIDRAIRNTATKSAILKCLQWARLFGGAGALVVLSGEENRLDEPLDLGSIEVGSYRGLIPFDKWSGIIPAAQVSGDFNAPLRFNLPESYRVQAYSGGTHFDVHPSRILRFCGPSVPAPEHQAQQYWGISVLEVIFEELRKRDNLSWNLISLSYRANLLAMRFPELAQALSGAGMSTSALQQFYARMSAVNELMSNQSLVMLPKDGELSQVNYSFSGLSDLYQQFQLDIAGAAEIPVSRLFGRTIAGLSSANDQDERTYASRIRQEQEEGLRGPLDQLYRVIAASELGEVPEDLELLFPSVMTLSEPEKAQLATSTTANIVSLYNSGILTKPLALKELKQASVQTEFGTNVSDEDIERAAREPERGPFGEMTDAEPEGEEEEEPKEMEIPASVLAAERRRRKQPEGWFSRLRRRLT